MSHSFNYEFDDEKGRHINNQITINHYHMAPENPMSNLQNIMGQMALFSGMSNFLQLGDNSNNNNPNNDIKQIQPRKQFAIANNVSDIEDVYYEISDDIKYYELQIESLTIHDNKPIIDIKFEKDIYLQDLLSNSIDIAKNVQHKLSIINKNTSQFIFRFNLKNIGNINVLFVDNDFFTSFMNRFRKGYSSASFKIDVAKKINIPFYDILNDINFIIDTKNIFDIKFEAIDSMYHIRYAK